ncbi:MAG: carboxypeptidase-like regulatory domain-containing protein, partial [Rhodothermales bacterium]
MRTPIQLLSLLVLCLVGSPVFAQSGKISGQVTDAATGDPLPGVNVVIDGTTQGTSTGADGYYSIINVRPGTYDVRASFIGFTPQVVEDVR